eukprot:TRINITY_DN63471_c0_g1_i1.p1 TRINITY_DN63471_c0_g1~~TRINITY_DN63471_c0_g1_i1.p1  ORF type:complete len:563 (+),score=70.01 TRINITY_DN63471_c0_g1_i1:82-1689(+)
MASCRRCCFFTDRSSSDEQPASDEFTRSVSVPSGSSRSLRLSHSGVEMRHIPSTISVISEVASSSSTSLRPVDADGDFNPCSTELSSERYETYCVCISRPPNGTMQHELAERILGKPLGMRLQVNSQNLEIVDIGPGLVQGWNDKHKLQEELVVKVGDYVMEVNGCANNGQLILEALKMRKCSMFDITLCRMERMEESLPQMAAVPSQSWLRTDSFVSLVKNVTRGNRVVCRFVAERIGQMYTSRGQEVRARVEATEQERVRGIVEKSLANPLVDLHAQNLSENVWSISGIYAHQALKVGFRNLDEIWKRQGRRLDDFPRGRFLQKKKLLQDMLEGTTKLNAVPKADLVAAQMDIKNLSAFQLVKLKVLCMDTDLKGGSHEAFFASVNNHVFKRIGEEVSEHISVDEESQLGRLGVDAVQILAARTALPSVSCQWAWWISPSQRTRFDATAFAFYPEPADGEVKEDGVYEVTDYSRREVESGLIRMDWSIRRVTCSRQLRTAEEQAKCGICPGTGHMLSEEVLATALNKLKGIDG